MAKIKRVVLLLNVVIATADLSANTFIKSRSPRSESRRLNQEAIIDYTPQTTVTDDAAIDLDQRLLEDEILKQTSEGFENAYNVYTLGAFSQSYAILKLDTNLTLPVPKGVDVTGNATDGRFVRGKTLEETTAGSNTLRVQYHVYPVQKTWTACHVGGNPQPVLERCYASTGTIEIDGMGMFTYSYNSETDNENRQTLQTLSTATRQDGATKDKIGSSETFQKFYDYYGQLDYGNQWILAAFHRTATHDFKHGNANFYSYDDEGSAVAVRRATIYMNLWMAVVLELDYAVTLCEQNDLEKTEDEQLYAWDKAVAFYTGSVTKQANGKLFEGHTLYTLAKERCMFSATCTDQIEIVDGESVHTNHANVNLKLFRAFNQGQQSLLEGDCSSAKSSSIHIIQQMAIPLIQGVIHYAYAMDLGYQSDDASNSLEAEGAVFAASVLPLLYHCNPSDGDILYENMRVGNGMGATSYDQIMTLLEKNLDCLGLTCQDIGGVADIVNDDNVYMQGGEPCHHTNAPPANSQGSTDTTSAGDDDDAAATTTDTGGSYSSQNNAGGPNVGMALGIVLGLVVGALLITVLISRKRDEKEFDGPEFHNQEYA